MKELYKFTKAVLLKPPGYFIQCKTSSHKILYTDK